MDRHQAGPPWSGDPDRELREELHFHIRERAQELEATGLDPAEALRRAHEEFGDVEKTLRYCHREDRRRIRRRGVKQLVSGGITEVAGAIRTLTRHPGAVVGPGAILAAAIALNALVFTVVRGVLLAPLPFAAADRVYVAEEVTDGGGLVRVSYPVLKAWREQASGVEAVSGYLENEFVLDDGEEPRHEPGAAVAEGFLSFLQAPLLMGRALTPEDHSPGAPHRALISEALWRSQYGASSDVLDRTIRLNGEAYAIAGVVRDAAAFPDDARVWLPIEASAPGIMDVAGAKIVVGLVRLRPGVSASAESQELARISGSVTGGAPDAALAPLRERLLGDVRTPLLLLQGAVLLVLLAACANAGGMLLARTVRRRSELAVRTALGAGRLRIAGSLLLEGLALGLAAGLVGLVTAAILLKPTLAFVPEDLPRAAHITLDPTVSLVALLLAAGTGLLTSAVPALTGGRTPPAALLREGGGSTGGTPWLHRMLEGLIVGQVALAVLLTVGAGLLLRSFVATLQEDPGFDPSRVTVVDISLPQYRYPDEAGRIAFARTLLERAHELPGAQAVALGRNLPISGSNMTSPLMVEGSAQPTSAVQLAWVSADYFDVLRLPLDEGAGFGPDGDRTDAAPLMIVDGLVRTADGRALSVGDRAHSFFGNQGFRSVVGIAGSVRHDGLRAAPTPVAYVPFFQAGGAGGFSLLVRSDAPSATVASAARAMIRNLDPTLPVDGIATMSSRIRRSVARPRFYAVGLGIFGALALMLALAGCQAGLAHRVAARRREMGLRMALGASGLAVRRMVVRRGLTLTVLGALVGVALALPSTRILRSQLYGLTSGDPVTYVATLILLLLAGALASDIPARRAAHVDPVTTLKEG